MTIKILPSNFSSELYNSVAAHPYQSWEFSKARERMKMKVIRFGEYQGDCLKKAFFISLHKLPNTHKYVGYLSYSLLPEKNNWPFIKAELAKKGVVFLRLHPYQNSTDPNSETDDLQKVTNTQTPFCNTLILKLNNSRLELFNNLSKQVRYGINRAKKNKVTVKEITNRKGFEIFVELLLKNSQQKGFFPHGYYYHDCIFRNMKKTIAHYLIAYHHKKAVSAYQLFNFNNRLFFPYGISTQGDKSYASYMLMWRAIEFGKKHGLEYLDFCDIQWPLNKYDSCYGFSKFKIQFGGEVKEMIKDHDFVIDESSYEKFKKMLSQKNKNFIDLVRVNNTK
jgi:hypothetical protein